MNPNLQAFRPNDALETKVRDCFLPTLDETQSSKNLFYLEAARAWDLGGVLYDLKRAPLVDVLPREDFIRVFPQLFQLFTRPGTYDYYLDLFRAIWGEDVVVEFTNPAAGVLLINIQAVEVALSYFTARRIVDNQYVYEMVTDHEGAPIAFQGVLGLKTQPQVDALMRSIKPEGIYVQATLTTP